MQKQHRIGPGDLAPGALNADALDLVHPIAGAQAGCVHHMQRHPFDLDGLLHHVAGGASNGGDDGQLSARERVEQRALARVGLAGDHHRQALAQQRALARFGQHRRHPLLQAKQLASSVGLLQKVDLFFGKVQCRLHQHAQVDQRIAQLMHPLRKRAGQ